MKRKIIAIIMSMSVLLTAVSCGTAPVEETEQTELTETEYSAEPEEDPGESQEPNQTIEDGFLQDETETTGTTEQQEIDGAVEFVFPEGAGSIYELYTEVTDFLNTGFNYDALNNVFDPVLSYTFFAKFKDEDREDFANGLSLQESCDLMARLVSIAEEQGMPLDEDGRLDDDLIDAEVFRSELPDFEDYEDFVEYLYTMLYSSSDPNGINPFGTEQISWPVVSEDALITHDFDDYDELCSGFETCFPNIIEVDLGSYDYDNEHLEMWFNCFEYNGRYYFLGFSSAVSSLGG